MREIESNIWYNEFLSESEGELFPIGWYFSDETSDFHGPYDSLEETRIRLQQYCEVL